MLKKAILSILISFISISVSGQSTPSSPRLVVNIIVGAMRAGDLDRYKSSFTEGGLLKLSQGGVNFTNANYNFSQTSTPVSLSTLSTGALPSSHGVIGEGWWEYILGDRVDLIHDKEAKNLDYNLRDYGFSAHRLSTPTLSESLLSENPLSQSVSIAIDPIAAIVMGGRAGSPYWVDPLTCEWGSSSAFMRELPAWVSVYNKSNNLRVIAEQRWSSILPKQFYINTFSEALSAKSPNQKYEADKLPSAKNQAAQNKITYEQLAYTPAGNRATLEYAKWAVEMLKLGQDGDSDILNIYLSSSRNIAQRYGVQSVEVEDMYCHLDGEIASFLRFLSEKLNMEDVVILLTSDHGMSPAYGEESEPLGRFNSQQFVVLTNSFLRARYGDDNWVLGYEDRNLYIDHRLVFKHNLNISEVQNEIASFALQFRGVAHAITATAMRNGYFGSGYGHKMQNGFYPRRSGDVMINLMPGWIEDQTDQRADAGSTYRYDSHIPLVIYGEGRFPQKTVSREVSMEDVAPTLSLILNIETPAASDGKIIEDIY